VRERESDARRTHIHGQGQGTPRRTPQAQRLLDINKASRNAPNEDHEDGEQENDQEVDRDEIDPYNEVTFGRRRPDSVVVD
jgi:hypothetical protein